MKKALFMLLASHLFFSCPYIPNDCEIVGDYEFVLPATLTPAKDTFQIGDTINVVSRFSDSLYERKTDQVYQAEDFKWSPLTYIYRLDTINGQSDFSRFDFILNVEYDYTIFNYSNGESSLIGQYNYVDHEYSLEFQIVPKKKGLYLLFHSSSLYGTGSDMEFEGKCPNVDVAVVVEVNGRASNNVDFILDSPDESTHVYWEKKDEKFFDAGGYCFYVKE